ncbi:leucyl aminopeptidase [Mobiluncus mulieris]|uniref:leucyl aminopeptidase n=1 Tax=Mobiluncus mulieris TaxID=2052 RepID=UPI0005871440|nr:leucyl aminopeptidase [Mobiluncus mulieris]
MSIIDTYSGSLSDCTSPLILGVSVDKDGHIAVPTCPALQDFARSAGVKGKAGEAWRTPTPHNFQAPFVIFAGLGDLYADCGATEVLREAAGAATRLAEAKEVVLSLPARSREETAAIAEGALLGGYRFDKYLTKKPQRLERILLPSEAPALDAYTRNRVEVIAKTVADIRDLVNTSPSALYPETLAKWMENAAKNLPVKVKIWNYAALKAEGFGGIVAVGRGSKRKPVLVKMTYEPAEYRAHIALVGKGITFDSGGYALKPPSSMVTMKADMTGAATMGNTVLAAARLQLPVKVTAWLTCAENMVSGGATRNDDIIIMKDGTSVEVNNTDAEGRLVMADGIAMALAQKPDLLVDMATLTGAQVVALGSRTAGVMGSAKDEYFAAAKRVGELAWPCPLPEHLAEDLKSEVADMRNSGTKREGGMPLAGLFLRHFTKDAYWAHVDIAGPGFNSGSAWGCTPKGGTGYGLRTLVDLLENFRKPSA